MIRRIFIKLFPFVFIVFFIYLESAPIYLFNNELVKPLMTFTVIYCWIQNDGDRFRPLWLLFFGLFYDLLRDGIVGITSFFFLAMYHLSNENVGFIATNYLNNVWMKFSIILLFYFLSHFFINFLFEDFSYAIYKNSISVFLSIILFPLFYSLIQKLSIMFGRLND
tara:strand:+ start:712 stop:1209 length:498 start_codon:yes stop_codon:yes gene_type:complete